MSNDRTNFLGIPISGDITNDRKDQRPQHEFEAIVRALLAEPMIAEFGWRQCTPYFNDGDACIFGAHGFWVRTGDTTTPGGKEQEKAAKLAALKTARDVGALTDRAFELAEQRINDEYDDKEEDEADEERLGVDYNIHPVLGGLNGYGTNARYVGSHESVWRKAKAVSDAIDDGEFDNVLLTLFGDHARIKVRRDGITVDTYEHD